jgi:phosphatidylglycerol lysyltransferase
VEQQGGAEVLSQEDALSRPGPVWLRRFGGPALSVLMLCLALWALYRLAGEVSYHQVGEYMHRLRRGRIGQAIVLTALGYAVMPLYDLFALNAIGRTLPRPRVALISFISYAFSNTLGMAMLVSGSIRYRFYIQAGLSTIEVAKVVLFCTISFWLGLFAITGVTLLFVPIPRGLPLASVHLLLGIVLCAIPVLWLAGGAIFRRPVKAVALGRTTSTHLNRTAPDCCRRHRLGSGCRGALRVDA